MSNEVHVVPRGDLVDHEDENCSCGPTTEPVTRDDGSVGWLIIHHSLDGREGSSLLLDAKAKAWDEGARSNQCHCAAYSDGECACGSYPGDGNPYRPSAP